MVSSKAHVLWAALWFLTWCKPTCLGNKGRGGIKPRFRNCNNFATLQDLFRSPRKGRSFPYSSRLFPCCKFWSIKVSERQSCGSLLCWHWNGLGSWAMKLSGAQHATVATFSKKSTIAQDMMKTLPSQSALAKMTLHFSSLHTPGKRAAKGCEFVVHMGGEMGRAVTMRLSHSKCELKTT